MAKEQAREQAGATGRGTDIDCRARFRVGHRALAILEVRLLAGIRSGDLVPYPRCPFGQGNRAGANDLVLLQRLVETRKGFSLGAGDTDPAVALGISTI